MGVSINDLSPEYRKQALRKLARQDRATNSTSNVEPSISNAPMAAQTVTRLNSPCRIHVHSVRKRLADADGISGKAAIDALTLSGLLQDDSPEFVREVSYSQEKGTPEKTIIEIYEVEESQGALKL